MQEMASEYEMWWYLKSELAFCVFLILWPWVLTEWRLINDRPIDLTILAALEQLDGAENFGRMEQHALKIVNNCLNTNIYSYLETSGGQSYNIYVVIKPEFSKFPKKIKVWSLSSSRCKFS